MEVAGEGDYIPIIIFSRGKIRKMPKFNFNEETVDVAWDYKYLGVKFNYNNKFYIITMPTQKSVRK